MRLEGFYKLISKRAVLEFLIVLVNFHQYYMFWDVLRFVCEFCYLGYRKVFTLIN